MPPAEHELAATAPLVNPRGGFLPRLARGHGVREPVDQRPIRGGRRLGAVGMNTKERTWPATLIEDPTDPKLWNVQDLAGHCVFQPGVNRPIAKQAWIAIVNAFDDGRGNTQ